ncbi:MAG: dTDP-4-dehydrorhamnose 3,5-epimerase [Tannerellaceae bacterium]|jgi:dTDP-4-dehydrorhamnose 3,5-epimerase|nr:dTDP-4-dehydrorhamnose 3,5-epimerase [Tannerellaceae bacterium]
MNYITTHIPGIRIIEPTVFNDSRGYFFEVYKKNEFDLHTSSVDFIQENESCSTKGVLRGLHFQLEPYSQAKLVRVIKGNVLDVAVDLRPESATFGQHIAVELSEVNKRQLFVPRGFAHGFHVLSNDAVFTYKVDNYYHPEAERTVRFDEPVFGIDWKIPPNTIPIMSDKDRNAPGIAELHF